MPVLRLIEPGKPPQTLELDGDVITVGRGSNNHLTLAEPAADAHHCALERTGDGSWRVVDLASAGGTLLNGRRVTTAPLSLHDELIIGSTRIVVERLEPPAPARPRPRPRRRRLGPRRRILLPPRPPAAKVFTFDDLKVVLESLIEEQGVGALDRIAEIVDEYHEEYRGTKLLAYLRGELEALWRVLEFNKALTQERQPTRLLEMILDGMIEITGAERGFIILSEGKDLTVHASRNFDRESVARPEYKISRTVAEQVIRTGRPLISMDALNDPEIPAAESVERLELRSLACVPLGQGDRVAGCVYLDNRFEAAVFLQSDLPLLEAFAEQAAIALKNARLHQQLLEKSRALEVSHAELDRLAEELRRRVQVQYDELRKIRTEVVALRPTKYEYRQIVGDSPPIRQVLHLLDRIVESDENVFIHGESGTGKELVARAIHQHSRRSKNPLVAENCSAIPETLLESELFGHEKGAFTGATSTHRGLFEQAHGGTLFLDEIGDMPLEMQKKLLRALQEGVIRRVGGSAPLRVDVRLISASHRDLKQLIHEGRFREDLFWRLNVVQIDLPPLRNRREDIPKLVDHFLNLLATESGAPRKSIEDAALWALINYDWPGNVRELENEIRRAVALAGDTISVDDLKEEIRRNQIVVPSVRLRPASPLKRIVDSAVEEVERRVITQVLEEVGWKKIEAARILGISRPTLDAKLERYGIQKPAQSQGGPTHG